MRTNISEILKHYNLELGCWDTDLDKKTMTKKAWREVVDQFDGDSTDIFLRIRGRLYIMSIAVVNNEADFSFRTGYDYFDEFGGISDAFDVGKISEDEYECYMKKFYGEEGWTWDEE